MEANMATDQFIPAAQYLRMSTEHQQYSTQNQAQGIRQYGESHGFAVTRTYSDPARSGLSLKNRPGLRKLLQDVAGGNTDYKAILVYDVSRWGRFQDTDESAHYEFLCRSAGIPVYYCAETFVNDGSLPSSIMKALKRAMAGEFSRELGEKVLAGKSRLAGLGFRTGGRPDYGFRRLLVSSERTPKQLLQFGERKSILTDRVILVPGPPKEAELVREIFRKFTIEKLSLNAIARELNRLGIPGVNNGQWCHSVVRAMLSHPKYVGCSVFNQTTARLGTPQSARPRAEWVISPGAHQGIVDPQTFAIAQELVDSFHRTNDQILLELRSLLLSKGTLKSSIIDATPGMVSAATLGRRFGGLRQAYALIGYKEFRNHTRTSKTQRSVHRLRWTVFSQILRIFKNEVIAIREGGRGSRQILRFNDGVKISVSICRWVDYYAGSRWMIPVHKVERDYPTLICRCTPDNHSLKDFHLMRRVDSLCKRGFLIREHDPWLMGGIHLCDLSVLTKMVNRLCGSRALTQRAQA
jgi:DNA invertase Pin-like site-specific DNA recombinase